MKEMRKSFRWMAMLFTALAMFLWEPLACHAEVVQGQAVIDPANPAKARNDAMQDAMRTFVEMKVGVHVQGETEVSMGMVVRDQILAKSDGYVLVNKIVKEWKEGPVYCVKLDLTASDQKIKTAIEDMYNRLQSQRNTHTSRSGVQVAVTGRDQSGKLIVTDDLMKYVQGKLEDIGFSVYDADEVKSYMDAQTDMNSPAVSANIRRIARNNQGKANALLRGVLEVSDVGKDGDYTRVTVHASFELVGLESSEVNSFDDYFTAADKNPKQALIHAKDIATQRAVESLGQKALLTIQSETEGGQHHLETTIMVNGVTDRSSQPQAIRQALAQMNCDVVRSSFTSAGVFKLFVESDAYGKVEDIKNELLKRMGPALQEGDENEDAMGSKKIYLKF